ncbi:aldo/keto reductase [Parablautia muri]|uniref:Aldo/keto reductase family oxidoreductase n=1 Tax=Parablautia muri TaxID=2320879 RepID=A0A9X5GUS0_9FIRM|nr:aldo/keto reductase [Parablautia muri]NBJ94377.1 aldo/keto reductase family oxidoreductase [Parablautia muri]
MKMIQMNKNVPASSAIGLGCMRLTGLENSKTVRELIDVSMEAGINFFDHADIYAGGEAEAEFGKVLTPKLRSQMVIQTKCAIRPGICYDFSKEHILKSVDGSLQRLNTEYIDILLLHRPDALMEPEEVAEAFSALKKAGKVRCFGVSNHNPMQMELLNSCLEEPLCVNQIQFSVAHCPTIDGGLNVNIHNDAGCNRDGSVIEYCRLKKMTIQAWSPFQYGMFEGVFIGNEKFPELNAVMNRLAKKYQVTPNAIAVAWIMRHPANIQTIVGSTSAKRVQDICKASDVCLTRDEWYEMYLSAGKLLP